jgi:hypothetical protein
MMILWTNDPLIKRNMLGQRVIGSRGDAKAQVGAVGNSSVVKTSMSSRVFPTQFGRPGRWRALAMGLEYWGMAGRCAC